MIKKTKIVVTIGPATETEEILEKLILAGADLFRFNLKHNTLDWHKNVIKKAKAVAEKLERQIGIIVDAPKPEIGLEVPEADFVALSYLKNRAEVDSLRQQLNDRKMNLGIIAKIENGEALKNMLEVVDSADGVMVARGDLGIEVPLEELAFWQKKIIDVCRQKNKAVIVATQMLQSMVNSQTPTRAEATDVANAVFDGTDAIMLSEESAIGKYPVEAVEYLYKIAVFCENNGEVNKIEKKAVNTTELLVEAAEKIVLGSKEIPIAAAIVFSQSGNTAKMLSSYRMKIPIIVITNNQETLDLMSLSYGVVPYFKNFGEGQFEIDDPIFEELTAKGLTKKGETILVIHGNNWINLGTTSDISLKTL
jgi:pyruvate kinase